MDGRVCEEQESIGLMQKVPSQGKIHEGDSEHHRVKKGGSLVSQQEMAREFCPLSRDECRKRMIRSLVSQQEMAREFFPLSREERWKRMMVHMVASHGKINEGNPEHYQVKEECASSLFSRDLSMMDIPAGTLATGTLAREWEEFQAWKADLKLRQRDNKRLAERGVDFALGEMVRYSPLRGRRRTPEERLQMIRSCTGTFEAVELPPYNPDVPFSFREMIRTSYRAYKHWYALMALESYESQDAEFEVVETLYAEGAELVYPGGNIVPPYKGNQEWLHVSFIAKPKNADSTDVSPKYFFGELVKHDLSGGFYVKYCSTFEPSDDPGFKHGCVLCPADQKFHPGPDGYISGHPPCYVSKQEIMKFD